MPGTILLAEDIDDEVLLMRILLRKCRVLNPLQAVSNGDEAIDYLQGAGIYVNRTLYPVPVLLLLDLKMPVRGGIEVLKWLQAQCKPAFPTIVLTGLSDFRMVDQARQLGAHTFLMKPIEQADFLPLIKDFKGIEIGH
jgi:CheY-like chemotaxis protein